MTFAGLAHHARSRFPLIRCLPLQPSRDLLDPRGSRRGLRRRRNTGPARACNGPASSTRLQDLPRNRRSSRCLAGPGTWTRSAGIPRKTGRKKFYDGVKAIQRDLDAYLVRHNTERPNQARDMRCMAPADFFVRCLRKPKLSTEEKMKKAA